MIGFLTIAGIALLALRKKRGVSGIGAVQKRRIYQEISELQRYYPHIDFTLNYEDQSEDAKKQIQTACEKRYNKVYPNRQPLTPERYYKQLKRAYNTISGIGETGLPYRESVVKNNYGDIILIHRDYGTPEQKLRDAIVYIKEQYIEPGTDDYSIGYWGAILAIATGTRFVWRSYKNHLGIEDLIFGKSAPTERKIRISYIANKEKGGEYPEQYAESLLQYSLGGDDREILDGVLEAIRSVESVKQAKDIVLDKYMRDHIVEEQRQNDDLPF